MRQLQDHNNARRLLDLTSDTLLLIDSNGICKDVEIHSNLWFLQESLLLDKNIFKLLPFHTLIKVYRTFKNVHELQTKIVRNFRLDLNGTSYYFKCIFQPFDGMVLCQYRDITERSNVKLQLERANHELNEIQKVAHIGQWRYNTADNIVHFTGYTNVLKDEKSHSLPLSRYIEELVVEEDREVFWGWLDSNVKKDQNDHLGYRIKYQDNIYYLRLETYAKTELPDGNFYLEGYVQNLTDIQRSRNDITILTHAINNAKESICAARKDGTMIFANRIFRIQNQIADNVDLEKLKIYDIVDKIPSIDDWTKRYKQVEPGKFVEYITYNPFKNNDKILAYEGTLYHVTRDDGESTYWAFEHDITERLQYEAQINQLNRIMDTVIENLPAGIVVKDVENDFKYLYRNRESFNVSTEVHDYIDPIGKNDFDFFSRAIAEKKYAEDIEISSSGKSVHRVEERRDVNGNSVILDKRKIKVEGKDFKPIILSIEWNITEMETMRRQLEVAKERAEKSDRLKSAFLANMSHEIRTPLNAIVGFSRIIAESEDLEERIGYFEIIDANNERLLHLINEILDLSKIESGIMEFNYAPVHLYKLAKEVFHAHTFKVPDGVKLIFNESEKALSIESDKNKLFQVLSNLIGNATKFTKEGSITYGYFQEQDKVVFYVEDTGSGISADKIGDVFGRFVKLDENVQGSGLGLSICEGIVHRLGGEISVESEFSKGTRFTFWIPMAVDKYKGELLNNSTQPSVNELSSSNLVKEHTILIGEDIDKYYHELEMQLSNKYNLVRASNGMEIVTLFDELKPNLILLRMELPELNGAEAVQIVRELSKEIPIVGYSSSDDENNKTNATVSGCNEFVNIKNSTINFESIVYNYLH